MELRPEPQKGGVDKPAESKGQKVAISPGNREFSGDSLPEKINKQDVLSLAQIDVSQSGTSAIATPALPENLIPRKPNEGPPLSLPNSAPFCKGGRLTVFTESLIEQLWLLLSIGFSRNQAAAHLGIDKSSISRAVKRDPNLALELRRAEELSDLQPELTLMTEARKNWRAAAWYLTHRAKNPRPLSEEEKEERHQAKLADDRRTAIEMCAFVEHGKEEAAKSFRQPRPGARRRRRTQE
ncbi:hypothetical protein [Anatilimnocola aggregata]|nr:hypothetical protein [Anatilimnocola aggregata]